MSDIYSSGDVQAAYWLGTITRKEAQSVYDEFASAIGGLQSTLLKLDAAIAFLFEKYQIDPADFTAWFEKKAAEADASSPIVTEAK